jgi:type IX secretion system PorP/SprF family membrane protein
MNALYKNLIMKNGNFFSAGMLAAGLLLSAPLYAQDPVLSQYFASPMSLNPALTGKGVSDWRLMGSYRSQGQGAGTEPYTTSVISVEKNLLNPGSKDVLGAGFMVMSDASNGGVLKHNFITMGISYNNALDAAGKQLLGGGISFSYARRMLDASKFVFQSQLGSGGYQPSIPAGDGAIVPNNSYIDINAGLHYSIQVKNSGFYTGISYFHAGKPKDGIYYSTEYTIDPRMNIQMGYQQRFANNSELQFSGTYDKQGEVNRFTAGLVYKLAVTGSQLSIKTINIGIWDRFGDAFYPYVGIDGDTWLLGLSYDVPTAKLSNSLANLQSFEISFGLLLGKKGNESRSVVTY